MQGYQVNLESSLKFRHLAGGINPWDLARDTLEQYQSEPQHTWKGELYGMKEEVLNVLRVNNQVFISKKMWLLEFTNTCSLWNELVLLEAPTK